MKKIMLFLLPLMIVVIGAGAYFLVWPKFNENVARLDNSPKVEESQTSSKESDNKLNELKKTVNDITKEESRFKYLGQEVKAYNNGKDYKEYEGDDSFSLGGIPYKRGFTIGTTGERAYANFNLNAKHKFLAGIAGCLDGVYRDATYKVLADDQLIDTIEVKAGYLPVAFEFDVTGVKQLKIVANGPWHDGNDVGFGNVVLYDDKNDKPALYEIKELPKVAYIGQEITSYVSSKDYEEYNGASTFGMGGKKYTRGFTIGTCPERGFVFFNIDGKYKSFSGLVGNLDKKNISVTYNVLGDGKSLGLIEVTGGNLPTSFNFDVTGIKQLNIIGLGKWHDGKDVGFADVVLQ